MADFNNSTDFSSSTAPESFPVILSGFPDEAEAKEIGELLSEVIFYLGSYINLERLDAVTVTHNYDETLSKIDRGFMQSKPLTRTNNDQLVGMAMSAPVLREGVVKRHLVFAAPLIMGLRNKSGANFAEAFYSIAHECGHVEDLKIRDECFPGIILRSRYKNNHENLFGPIVDSLWEEYAACFISAKFGPKQIVIYQECLKTALANAREKSNAAIREYRIHDEVARVLEEAGYYLCEPLRMAAYLIGHLDGLHEEWNDHFIRGSVYEDFINETVSILRDLWSHRGQWKSIHEFKALYGVLENVFASGGIILEPMPDSSLSVNIPITQDTVP